MAYVFNVQVKTLKIE